MSFAFCLCFALLARLPSPVLNSDIQATSDTQATLAEISGSETTKTESTFSPFTDLSAFSVGLGSFKTNYSFSDLQIRLGPALYLGNPNHTEYVRLDLGYDNKLTGFIADTGLFANLGYVCQSTRY